MIDIESNFNMSEVSSISFNEFSRSNTSLSKYIPKEIKAIKEVINLP
jgi:hypothetical protein